MCIEEPTFSLIMYFFSGVGMGYTLLLIIRGIFR